MNGMKAGLLAALGAFSSWGVFGLYFHALGEIPSFEVLAHRVLGTALVSLVVLAAWGRLGTLRPVLADRRLFFGLAASSAAIGANWVVFIWSAAHGHALEASLGYYIYPLVSVLLARVVLGERLSRRKVVAVVLAAIGVGWLVLHANGVPWVAVALAVSMGAYGLLRKTLVVSSLTGLAAETLWMVPLAVLYLVWAGGGQAFDAQPFTLGLLALAGPVTAVPLILFAFAARRLPLATLGMVFYVNPTVQMLVAVFLLGEGFTDAHKVAFAAIWSGLALYSWPERRQGVA
jgi:chloramphenicol-sensitive protein RarD